MKNVPWSDLSRRLTLATYKFQHENFFSIYFGVSWDVVYRLNLNFKNIIISTHFSNVSIKRKMTPDLTTSRQKTAAKALNKLGGFFVSASILNCFSQAFSNWSPKVSALWSDNGLYRSPTPNFSFLLLKNSGSTQLE